MAVTWRTHVPQAPALHTATAGTPGTATPASVTEVGPSLHTIVEEPVVPVGASGETDLGWPLPRSNQ